MYELTKALAVKVPEDAPYITEGKTYDIKYLDGVLFSVVDDKNDTIMCCFDGLCGHGITWRRVVL